MDWYYLPITNRLKLWEEEKSVTSSSYFRRSSYDGLWFNNLWMRKNGGMFQAHTGGRCDFWTPPNLWSTIKYHIQTGIHDCAELITMQNTRMKTPSIVDFFVPYYKFIFADMVGRYCSQPVSFPLSEFLTNKYNGDGTKPIKSCSSAWVNSGKKCSWINHCNILSHNYLAVILKIFFF